MVWLDEVQALVLLSTIWTVITRIDEKEIEGGKRNLPNFLDVSEHLQCAQHCARCCSKAESSVFRELLIWVMCTCELITIMYCDKCYMGVLTKFRGESGLSYIAESRRVWPGRDKWNMYEFSLAGKRSIEHCRQREQCEQEQIAWKKSWGGWEMEEKSLEMVEMGPWWERP